MDAALAREAALSPAAVGSNVGGPPFPPVETGGYGLMPPNGGRSSSRLRVSDFVLRPALRTGHGRVARDLRMRSMHQAVAPGFQPGVRGVRQIQARVAGGSRPPVTIAVQKFSL
jgi:hypothetical protein